MKENSGQQAQKRRKQSCFKYVIGFGLIYVFGVTLFEAHFAGSFVPDVEVGKDGRTRVRRRPDRQHQRLDPNAATYVTTTTPNTYTYVTKEWKKERICRCVMYSHVSVFHMDF
jgi:hypothetical protein